ncbi:MAG: hypothetical protein HQK76_04140 [Desulfobacterales bacterium]|nr:hypothetical protein [Desulfobacterales bacterium]
MQYFAELKAISYQYQYSLLYKYFGNSLMGKKFLLYYFLLFVPCYSFAEETIKIAAIFAKTGEAETSNLLHLQGVRFAVDTLNY